MRAVPYFLPLIITSVFVATAATSFVWVAMSLVLVISLLRKSIGKFSVSEVLAEYDFFHHTPFMSNLKTVSGFFFVGFNIWILAFLAHNVVAIWAFFIFLYSVVILNSNFAIALAHDLMHSDRKLDRWLSTVLLLQNGFFYLEADHIYIHHRHVGTCGDPATAKVGESLYKYLKRSVGARFSMIFFRGSTFPPQRERGIIRASVARAVVCFIYLTASVFVSLQAFGCVLAQFVLVTLIYESVTYIQHYGLARETDEMGKPEVVQLHHAWNCYYRTSAWMHYFMPVHSIHHMREERLDEIRDSAGPAMPLSFASMMVTAYFPTRWFRLMDVEVTRFTPQKTV